MDSFSEQREKRTQLLSLFDEVRRVEALCDSFYNQYWTLEREKQVNLSKSVDSIFNWGLLGIACIVVGGVGLIFESVLGWLFLPGIIFTVYFFATKNKKVNKLSNSDVVKKTNSQQDAILDKIDEVYNKSCIAGIYPQKYLFSDAVEYCYTLIEDMRADSIKEAINLYEEIMFRERIEQSQVDAMDALRSIDKETAKTRKAAQFAALASGISAYYSRKTYKNT